MNTTIGTESLTIEQITQQAREENLSNKKIRSLLFHSGFDHKIEFPAIRDALGREIGDSGDANRAAKLEAEAAAKAASQAREEREAAEHAAKVAAAREERVLAESGLAEENFARFKKVAAGSRRVGAIVPGEMSHASETSGLRLEFSLPAGVYATTLLRELMKSNPAATGAG